MVYPYVLSSQGWVKASPVESWFRERLGTNIAVESCGNPQSACPWHVPTLPVHVVAMRSCSHCCSFLIPPHSSTSGVEKASLSPSSLFLGKRIKARSSHQGWVTQALKRGEHSQGSGLY